MSSCKDWTWRLNENLPGDSTILADLEASLKTYFELNTTDEVSAQALWEGHKTVILGVLIVHGSRIKKLKLQKIDGLLEERNFFCKISSATHGCCEATGVMV